MCSEVNHSPVDMWLVTWTEPGPDGEPVKQQLLYALPDSAGAQGKAEATGGSMTLAPAARCR